jgi:ADP-heptose:LPS heptosyltransferase
LKKNNSYYNLILKSDSINEFSRLQELFNAIYKQIFTSEFSVHNILLSSKPDFILDKKYLIIAPSASDADRNWSQNNFRELCEKLSKKYFIYLLGLQSQAEYLSVISDGLTHVQNLAGKLRLDECIHLIQNSVLFVGLDSGFTHIAYSFNKPFVAIIGGGKFGRFFPYPEKKNGKYKYYKLPCFNCNWQCIYEEVYCVSHVSVEDVYHTCISMMDNY